MNDRVRSWILKHDDCKIFIIVYIGMAVLLSLLISLFWLAFVVFIHFALELIRQYYLKKSGFKIFINALWETKLDIALVLFALFLDVYLDFIFGIAGIGAGARVLTQTGSRIAIWQRIIRGVIITLDDAVQVLRFTSGKKNNQESVDTERKKKKSKAKVSAGDILSISLGLIMLILIFLAPIITQHNGSDVIQIILEELHPWPK